MTHFQKLNLISILLVLVAVVMIALGFQMKIAAPPLTGVGFILLAWAIQILKKEL
ncbi:MAG: hypothetical protein ACTHYV_07285 [Psychroflexus sp.]|uniref:hypothetical protein n=1 Tax=Psychroflexus sp. S27 TaxID=1982757 RepID=UPI0018654131|nr:hypothetical protein [Psychroflexus sp. S27]